MEATTKPPALAEQLPIAEIISDGGQPRRSFDETEMQELTDSVREHGVLQPVAVRRINDPKLKAKYQLIFGERRLRASLAVQGQFKTRNTIPAIVMDVTPEQAQELQIVENLQRADVHPMQEAAGFLKLEARGMTVDQIAARVGKSIFYTRQRIKLNALTPAWQEIFAQDKIDTKTAILIGRLSEESQKSLYKECVRKEGKELVVNNLEWKYKQLSLLLKRACFPLDDATLNPKMGPCIGCPFNSATASLFQNDGEQPKCGNAPCYELKTKVQIDRQLKIVADNPDILFVKPDYSNTPLSDQVEKKGKKIVDRYEWKPAEGKPEDLEARFQEGKVAKALAVNGDNMGRFIYGTVSKSSSTSSGKKTKKPEKGAKVTAEDCDIEIQRLQYSEKRKKQLDQVKVHKDILTAVEKNDAFKKPGLKMQPADRTIMIYLLLNEINSITVHGNKDINELIGIPDRPYGGESYQEKYFEKLAKVTDAQLALIIRAICKKKWGNADVLQSINSSDWPMLQIAKYLDVDIKGLQKAQEEVAATRIERVNKRIQQQKDLKKGLAAAKPAQKKVPVKKTAAKKAPRKK